LRFGSTRKIETPELKRPESETPPIETPESEVAVKKRAENHTVCFNQLGLPEKNILPAGS